MTDKPVTREAQLRWVDITTMQACPAFEAQRELRENRVEHLVASFDLEQMGAPTVNLRDDKAWIIDGNHRVEALRRLGFGDDKIECWTYEGLTLEQEADIFLKLNDALAVDAMTKFRVSVRAGRTEEVEINEVVTSEGLKVTNYRNTPGAIKAVGALHRAYRAGGTGGLRRTLVIIRDAFGDSGYEAAVLAGIGEVVARYGDNFDDEWAIRKLRGLSGGVKGLVNMGNEYHLSTGHPKYACVAAAVVDVYNRGVGRGGKLTSWWK